MMIEPKYTMRRKNAFSAAPIAIPNDSPVVIVCEHCGQSIETKERTRTHCIAPACRSAYAKKAYQRTKVMAEKRKAKVARMEALRAAGLA